jgi:5-methylcytosine-specific restriction endonuclease McrA
MKEYKNTSKKKKVAPVSTRTILVRDNFTCAFCGCKLTFKNGTRDHIIPVSRGGKNVLSNLAASCKTCNLKKDNKLLSECGMKLLFKPRELTSEEVLKCRIKTLSSKERNTWVDWLKANNVTIW